MPILTFSINMIIIIIPADFYFTYPYLNIRIGHLGLVGFQLHSCQALSNRRIRGTKAIENEGAKVWYDIVEECVRSRGMGTHEVRDFQGHIGGLDASNCIEE